MYSDFIKACKAKDYEEVKTYLSDLQKLDEMIINSGRNIELNGLRIGPLYDLQACEHFETLLELFFSMGYFQTRESFENFTFSICDRRQLNVRILKFFVEKVGIDADCIMSLAYNGHCEGMKYFLNTGGDIHHFDDVALMHSIMHPKKGVSPMTKLLLEAGVNVNAQCGYALILARQKNDPNSNNT